MKRIFSVILSMVFAFSAAISGMSVSADDTTLSEKLTDISDFELSSVELTQNKIRIGTNLGNYFEGYEMRENYTRPEGITDYVEYKTKLSGYPIVTEDYFKFLKDSGIQAVRVPITWFPMLTENGTGPMVDKEVWYDSTKREELWYNGVIHKDWLAKIKEVVDWIIGNDMYCIINIHHDGANNVNLPVQFDSAHMEQTKKYFQNIWGQVGNYFKDYGSKLIFEGFNEVTDYNSSTMQSDEHEAATLEALKEFISIIRSQGGNNPNRFLLCPGYNGTVFLGTNSNGDADDDTQTVINKLRSYDTANDKLILSSHTYPSVSSASWRLGQAKDLMSKVGIGCIFGEIGVTPSVNQSADQNPKTNNANFAKDVRQYSDQYKVSCFWWDGPGRTHGLTNRYYNHPNDANGFGNYVGKTIACPTFTDISQMADENHPYWAKFYSPDSTLAGAGKYAIVCSQDKLTELKVATNQGTGYYYMHFENYDGLVTLYLSDDGINYTRDFTGVACKFGELAYQNYKIYGSTANTVQLGGNYDYVLASGEDVTSYTYEAENLAYTSNKTIKTEVFSDGDCGGNTFVILDRDSTTPSELGDYCEFTLPNLTVGTYNLTLKTRTMTTRSLFDISVNGTTQITNLDFSNEFGYNDVNCGQIYVDKDGNTALRFTISQSNGTGFFIDKILLEKVEQQFSVTIDETENQVTNRKFTFPETADLYVGENTVYKAGETITVDSDISFASYKLGLSMCKGASMRLNQQNGLRFYTNVDSDVITALRDAGVTVKMGTLISPEDLLSGEELTLETAENKRVNVEYNSKKYYTEGDFSGVVGSIVNILDSNAVRDFIGRGYVTAEYNGVSKTVYANYYNSDVGNNKRSIGYLAYKIQKDTSYYPTLGQTHKEVVDKYADFYAAKKDPSDADIW